MTELATVLWNPRPAFDKIRDGHIRTATLVITILIINFGIALALLPQVRAAAAQAITVHPEIAPSLRWIIMTFSIAFISLINLALALFVALLAYFTTVVSGGAGTYRRIFEVILIGSSPLVLSHVVRVLLHTTGLTAAVLPSIVPLALLFHGATSPLARIAGSIDLIDLWGLALFAYGYSRISGLRRATSYGIVIVLWCILQGVSMRLQMMVAS